MRQRPSVEVPQPDVVPFTAARHGSTNFEAIREVVFGAHPSLRLWKSKNYGLWEEQCLAERSYLMRARLEEAYGDASPIAAGSPECVPTTKAAVLASILSKV